ncbi:MAG: protein kinase domain-containing protein [Nostoc sp. DedVER02]|uniref:serine/threonine-protein kinase n=1 Tax=unclassified Nostoc TaxID=2593658 RepID=UPI002AD42C70|nr:MULTISPECIES: serine/threonine-protein kinase [unclassified Nostoc]MDZ7989884.1 serine/threonine-protein kinase [Nostoc sp. DedVER02]MDZ8114382.1 serine/threonine-protein kinase [Nostoc sp. DedVER01b]
MQPPITVGTVLQNRYRIIQILGQGGFGRTYLAEDQRRFNELCAIKELISTATETLALQKAQELFHREAAILYQIEHPQVPKFRERFEQDERLFLVEDYVAGQTYRNMLDERLAVGRTFTEAEILQLIQSLLPVLEHIHSRGIIHRDISPENIILRDSDAKPVLIDFGVVKELATRLRSPESAMPETTVGKLGYSPSEQMQTGGAYPSSDLYALAVSAIVLLTGKEPRELFDENQLTWNWQRWVKVSPRFAQVLNRMLNHLPSDRYQSAASVSQALQPLEQVSLPPLNASNLQTMAVGRRPDSVPPASPKKQPDPVIPPSSTSSVLDNPLAIGAIATAVVIVAGFGSWALVSSIRSQSKPSPTETLPQNFPSPVISGGTTFTATPTPTTEQPISKRLNLGANKTVTVTDTLKTNQIIQYTFFGRQGEKLTAFIDPGTNVLLKVLSPNEPVNNNTQPVTAYEGILLVTGRYTIELTLVSGVAESNYNLNVSLEKPVIPTPTATPTPIPTETPFPIPTETPIPIPTQTPIPIPTETPIPIPTQTPIPIPTETPLPIPTQTPIPTPTIGETPTLPPTDGTQPFSGQRN